MRKILTFLIVFICSFIFVTNASATSYTARGYILDQGANVRTGPGTQNTRLTSLGKGSYYILVE